MDRLASTPEAADLLAARCAVGPEASAAAPDRHVALLVGSLRGGGAERVMSILARGLHERGLRVDLLLVEATGPYLTDIPSGVRIIDLKCVRVLTALPSLVRYLRRERPDALLSTESHVNLVAAWAKALARVSTRVVLRQANMLKLGAGRRLKVKEKLIAALLQRACSNVDAVVVLNSAMAEEFQRAVQLPRRHIRTIHNPVDADGIQAKANERLAHPWFKSGEPPVVLSVGRLSSQKDFATLIDAFAIVRASRPARLIILGEGELRDSLHARVNALRVHDDVALPGFDTNPYKYMRHASVFVLPSRWEGFPNALVEAMACGTPVVATDCPGGVAEILGNGEWGRLVEVGDASALAKALVDALSATKQPDVCRRTAAFSARNAVAQYLDVLLDDGK